MGSVTGADVDDSGAGALPNEKPANGLGAAAGVVEAGEEAEDWPKEKEGVEDVEAPKEKPVKGLDAPEGGTGEEVPDVGAGGMSATGAGVGADAPPNRRFGNPRTGRPSMAARGAALTPGSSLFE